MLINKIKKGQFVLIAEIGVNYYDIAKKENISNMEAAKKMIQEAKNIGIDAVKFQTYKAETIAVKESPSYWDTAEEKETSQYALFKKFDSFGYKEYLRLSNYCKEIGIDFLSTAFDNESADYLDEMMDIYKISSSDLSNIPFIEYQAKKKKPIIISAGASNEEEIDRALQSIRKYNSEMVVLMHCVLEYPTPYAHANLNKIISLKQKYKDVIIGYSDHTKPDLSYDVIKTAYNLGATVIEKHFTLDKTLKGNDHYHAMDVKDAEKIIESIRFVDTIRGEYAIKCLDSEKIARQNARRSLVAVCDIKKGERINREMLTHKRPGIGISPAEIDNVIGKVCNKDIQEDTILQYSFLVEADSYD